MKNYNFVYNYGFLADWFKANPTIKRYDVLANMGMSDYRTLQNWMEGITIMPVHQIMKFCNLYNVPIHAFFYDECSDDNSIYAKLRVDSMIEPAGGYPEASRTGLKLSDPRTDTHTSSNLPEYCNKNISKDTTFQKESERTSDIPQNERMRYLDIIEKLNDRVMLLSKENASLQIAINNLQGSNRYLSMVAENEETADLHR